MTEQELNDRARRRAIGERLHTFKVCGEPAYLVRSRSIEPGSMHRVTVAGGRVVGCSNCAGWEYRRSCTHAAAVTRRLEREGKSADKTHYRHADISREMLRPRRVARSEATR